MTGMKMFAFDSSFWRSRPPSPGNRMSSTRQLTTLGNLLPSNSVAEPNKFTLRPTESKRPLSESRYSSSSSTTKTIGSLPPVRLSAECCATRSAMHTRFSPNIISTRFIQHFGWQVSLIFPRAEHQNLTMELYEQENGTLWAREMELYEQERWNL